MSTKIVRLVVEFLGVVFCRLQGILKDPQIVCVLGGMQASSARRCLVS